MTYHTSAISTSGYYSTLVVKVRVQFEGGSSTRSSKQRRVLFFFAILGAGTIQGRVLFKGGYKLRNYGILNVAFFLVFHEKNLLQLILAINAQYFETSLKQLQDLSSLKLHFRDSLRKADTLNKAKCIYLIVCNILVLFTCCRDLNLEINSSWLSSSIIQKTTLKS